MVPYQVGLLELEWDVLMIVSCVVDLVFVSATWQYFSQLDVGSMNVMVDVFW